MFRFFSFKGDRARYPFKLRGKPLVTIPIVVAELRTGKTHSTSMNALLCCGSLCQFLPASVNNHCSTLLLTQNARIKDVDGKMQKDKRSEHKSSGVMPKETMRFSDTADKIVWTKFGEMLKDKGGNIVPARLGK